MWDNTEKDDSAGYADPLTDAVFFGGIVVCCIFLGACIWMVLL